jgi:hypothetical protein
VSVGDQANRASEEGFVDIVASCPPDPQVADPCSQEVGHRPLDDPTKGAQAGAVGLAAFGDHRTYASVAKEPTVPVVIVAAVGEEPVGPSPRSTDNAGNGRDLVEQGQQLGDVVVVAAGQRHREREALAVGDDVLFAARSCAVDRAESVFEPVMVSVLHSVVLVSGVVGRARPSSVASSVRRKRTEREQVSGGDAKIRSPRYAGIGCP